MKSPSLIAAVGQPWMRDLAFGCHVVRRLEGERLPAGLEVRDLSFGPIAAFQAIREGGYRRIVFVTSRAAGRTRGRLYRVRPSRRRVPAAEIHARIGDSVMGCISLENLVVLCRHYRALPREVTVIEAEPEEDGWGPELSPGVEPLVAPAARLAMSSALGRRATGR